jgi:hypothetical protein
MESLFADSNSSHNASSSDESRRPTSHSTRFGLGIRAQNPCCRKDTDDNVGVRSAGFWSFFYVFTSSATTHDPAAFIDIVCRGRRGLREIELDEGQFIYRFQEMGKNFNCR